MVRLITSDAESQNFATEGLIWNTGTVVFDTGTFHAGAVSYKCGSASSIESSLKYTLAGALGVNYYASAFIRFQTSMPASTQSLMNWKMGGGTQARARVSAAGKLQLWTSSAQLGSDSAATMVADTWYRIELRCKIGTGAVDEAELLLDGTQVAISTGQSFTDTALDALIFGWSGTPAANAYLFVDDVAINDDTGGTDNGFPSAGTGAATRTATPVTAALTNFDLGPWTPVVTFSGGGGTRTASPVTASIQAVGLARTATPISSALQAIGTARQATPVTAALYATATRTAPSTASLTALGTARTATPIVAALTATATRTAPTTASLFATGSRTAPNTTTLKATATRTASTIAALLAASSRTAVEAAALQAIGTGRQAAPVKASVSGAGTPTPLLVSPAVSGVSGTNVTFVWRTVIDPAGRALHSRLVAAPSPATVNGDGSFAGASVDVDSATTAGFEYDTSAGNDGSGPWVAYPSTGLTAANQGREARYTGTVAPGATDWRVRLEAVGV